MKKKLTKKQTEVIHLMRQGYVIGLPLTNRRPSLFKDATITNDDHTVRFSTRVFNSLNDAGLVYKNGYKNYRQIYFLTTPGKNINL